MKTRYQKRWSEAVNQKKQTIQWTKDTKKRWSEAVNQSRTDNTMNKRYQKRW
jgi:hypothetical protein